MLWRESGTHEQPRNKRRFPVTLLLQGLHATRRSRQAHRIAALGLVPFHKAHEMVVLSLGTEKPNILAGFRGKPVMSHLVLHL